ncbi:hypothetical protein HDV01_005375 [Terramyces sp. JEL0728]|nr:hypothetical protein HDV01_005375 [Terramyces sp. JEL0728]
MNDELDFFMDDDIFKLQIEDALHCTNKTKQERFNQDLKLWEEAMKRDDAVNHLTQVFESALIM